MRIRPLCHLSGVTRTIQTSAWDYLEVAKEGCDVTRVNAELRQFSASPLLRFSARAKSGDHVVAETPFAFSRGRLNLRSHA